MKQFILFAVLAFLFSCSGGNKKQENPEVAYDIETLLSIADQNVDKTVTVVGFVTHTCKHSGKKCFIESESQVASLRIEIDPDGEIEAFSPDLTGSKLVVTGILKEQHLSAEFIDERENSVKQFEQEGGSPEVCAAEFNNISSWRKWMKDNDKDYYVMYYMDGLKYELLD